MLIYWKGQAVRLAISYPLPFLFSSTCVLSTGVRAGRGAAVGVVSRPFICAKP